MASLRRNRTMPTDGAISKFLYTIMKQLDLKSIDWQEVANQLDITNGHAARMRYSRFKAQMEGTTTQTRKPRATGPRQRKAKPDKPPATGSMQAEEPQLLPQLEPIVQDETPAKHEVVVKAEPGVEESMEGIEPTSPPEPAIKEEPGMGEEASWSGAEGVVDRAVSSGDGQQDSKGIGMKMEAADQAPQEANKGEQGPAIKAEPFEET